MVALLSGSISGIIGMIVVVLLIQKWDDISDRRKYEKDLAELEKKRRS